jgi:hypothetical protein
VDTRNRGSIHKLKKTLWPETSLRPVNLWAVLDAARDERIYDLVSRCYLEKCCLLAGDLVPQLERSAPHLVQISPHDSVTDSLLMLGWGDAWGIFVRSDTSIQTLRRHLRTLLRVKDESGRYLLFRYYDPRVLRAFLPTCRPAELKTIFGASIMNFFVETEDPSLMASFELDDQGALKSELARLSLD